MHQAAYSFVKTAVANVPLQAISVYEVGSRNINGSIQDVFDGCARYHGIDVAAGPGVDVVADAATYTPPFEPDIIVCCEVLEHVEAAAEIVAQAVALLKPGGFLLLTMAGEGRAPHSAVDGGPLRHGEFYQNRLESEVRRWTHGIKVIDLVAQNGDLYFVGQKERATV